MTRTESDERSQQSCSRNRLGQRFELLLELLPANIQFLKLRLDLGKLLDEGSRTRCIVIQSGIRELGFEGLFLDFQLGNPQLGFFDLLLERF